MFPEQNLSRALGPAVLCMREPEADTGATARSGRLELLGALLMYDLYSLLIEKMAN